MKERFRRLSGWLAGLLIVALVLASAAGCGGQGMTPDRATASEQVTEASIQTESETKKGTSGQSAAVSPGEPAGADSESPAEERSELSITEDGVYTSKEEVALYLYTYGKLPSNYLTKKEAEALGWKKQDGRAGQLDVVAPGMSIGGDRFGNYEGLLPDEKGRKYYECDINYAGGNRGAERIIYSNDGLIFYTGDHYQTFEQLYPEE